MAIDKALPNIDIAALQGGQGAELLRQDMEPELDIQIEDPEADTTLDPDGGATVNLGGRQEAMGGGERGFFDNLVDVLTEEEVATALTYVASAYDADKMSRKPWEDQYLKGLDLLGLKREVRTEPFDGATGVVHPLLLEAVGQFQSGAYKELIPANGPCQTKILGKETPELMKKSVRVKSYMNYKLMYEMEEYEAEYDQMLFFLALAGSAFKKVYRDGDLQRAVSKFVPAEELLVPYTAVNLRTAQRVTHVITMEKNELRKLMVSGFYKEVDLPGGGALELDETKDKYRELEGKEAVYNFDDGEGELTLLECHGNFVFESVDGEYSNVRCPYIVTVLKETAEVIGVRRNWNEGDEKKQRRQFFVHYKFTPGLGFYGFGMIHLLGNLSEAATANLRQLIDSGTFANMQGGFKARGMKVNNEQTNMAPGEWRDIDVPGNTIRDAILPLPYKEPSATLFQLLGFVVQAAEKFVGTQELGIADGNKETPVGTTLALLERGTKIMSAVHKRMHGALKIELKLLKALFAEEAKAYPYEVDGAAPEVFAEDFGPQIDVVPVSDPNIFSMAQRVILAQEQLKLAMTAPELHNTYEAFRRMYAALGVENIDEILKPTPQPMPEGPAMENARMPLIVAGGGAPLKVFPDQDHEAHIAAHMAFAKSPVVKLAPPVYAVLLGHVYEHISVMSENYARQQLGMPPMVPPTKEQPMDPTSMDPKLQAIAAQMQAKWLVSFSQIEEQFTGQDNSSDPLLAAKYRELELRKEKEERDARLKVADMKQKDSHKSAEIEQQDRLTQEKIASQEKIAFSKMQLDKAKMAQDAEQEERDRQFQAREGDKAKVHDVIQGERERQTKSELTDKQLKAKSQEKKAPKK